MNYIKLFYIALEFVPEIIKLVKAVQDRFSDASGAEKAHIVTNVIRGGVAAIEQSTE